MTAKSLAIMATDSHGLMVEADNNCKAHAAIRNQALWNMAHEYGLLIPEIETLTGIPARTIQNALMRLAMKKANQK